MATRPGPHAGLFAYRCCPVYAGHVKAVLLRRNCIRYMPR